MSGSQTRRDNATELRLDYERASANRLVIVIQGVPTTINGRSAPSTVGLERTWTSGPNRNGHHGTPSSPLIDEARAIDDTVAYAPTLVTSLVVAAWRGQEARMSELAAATIEDAPVEDQRRATALADHARAILCNGRGRYRDALAASERACAHEDLSSCAWAVLELVEAASRSNARGVAWKALDRLEELASIGSGDWALGVRARSAALLREGDQAEALYQQAIELLGDSHTAHLARAQLVYGEWLRRERRRVDARLHLRAALDTFRRLEAAAFADRALRELLATGETARKRTDDTRGALTPQEAQIARLAQDGFSNPEIGAQLFLSPRTVQYHLRKVFQKLDITSRYQLGRIPVDRLAAYRLAA